MLLTQLGYFVALAREEHFGRAAAAEFVSPSTLSESIRKLEIELGVPLVLRGHSYQGLTDDGSRVLDWARRIVTMHRALRDDVASSRRQLTSRARIGVIPSGIQRSARLVASLHQDNPLVTVSVSSGLTSENIVAGIRSFEFDAGIIHPSAADAPDLHSEPLPSVRAMVVGKREVLEDFTQEITGSQLMGLPLCLLEPHMRARQLFDESMKSYGFTTNPVVETDSVEMLLALATEGRWVAVVPESSVPNSLRGLRALRLVDPDVLSPLSLVRLADEPLSPVAAAIDAARERQLF